MPAKRLTMRKIRELLRLKFDCHLTNRDIAKSCAISHSTVGEHLRRFAECRLSWPLSGDIDDEALENLLFPPSPPLLDPPREPLDFVYIHKELRRRGVTMMLLWQEYKAIHPTGYQYSQFCYLYRQWAAGVDPLMRHEHPAGERLCVDWAGMTVDITDRDSGALTPASIFVAVLPASNYSYAEATMSQDLANWIGAHCRAFAYFGGVPRVVIPDNTKTAVTKACYYEPDINPSYLEMANHYGTAILPARVKKPRDKA